MAKEFTFGDVHRLLGEFGFKKKQVPGPHGRPYILFEHEPTGALQAFRAHRPSERIDPMTLAAVRVMLAGNGFLERDEFDDALRKASANGEAKAKRTSGKARLHKKPL
jgi:hypothetical protein